MILQHFKILILLIVSTLYISANVIIEDAEDNTTSKWRVVQGEDDDIVNLYDNELKSRVIEFKGGGSYKLGSTSGDKALNLRGYDFISWKMKTTVPYTIYIITKTKKGLRYLFYVSTPSRGLKHGFENGIHHGLGKSTISGKWKTITRDLNLDLQDAEPDNEIIAVNGIIFSGGNGCRMDNILLYNPKEDTYIDKKIEVKNSYKLDINGSNFKIMQWRFKGFGNAEILDERGIIRDIDAFEFRIEVNTTKGKRDLVYTLGEDDLGLIEDNQTIHHALGDDRTIGSVWAGDNPMNELGLWQGITRDLQEDIKDFEANNTLISIKSFQVKNSGFIKELKNISRADANLSEDENSTKSRHKSNSVGINIKLFLLFQLIYLYLIVVMFFDSKRIKNYKGLL
jgi:hypothetical protein